MISDSRPQPPHIEDGPGLGHKETLKTEGAAEEQPQTDWLKLAQDSFHFSTSYIDSNYRKKWEDSLRAFNNQHSQDSKYNSPNYDKRSKIFRPKTRTIVRKNEAAAAAAFFSNMDTVSVQARNTSNKAQQVSAEVMKELLEYRLAGSSQGIPWFLVVLGGLQDAQNQGVVCGHVYWDYDDQTDKPCCDLIPVENIRIDPAASWMDPVRTSPYLIELMPVYAGEVKERMKNADKKGKTWKKYGDEILSQAAKSYSDSTTTARNENKTDPYTPNKDISDYQTVWVQRHIHRRNGEDWHFYTLGDIALLSEPERLKEVVFHGMRPYVIGCCILETHRIMPSSVPELSDGLQKEANEIANQRIDNVKFVLNKGYRVKRGRDVDLASLVRNVPGRITLAEDPKEDIVEENWPDVTSSSYQEQDRIDRDMDELLGNFSPMSLPNRKGSETAKGMTLLEKPANLLTEYLIRTYVETFVEPVLKLLMKTIQEYETDEVIINLAAERAKLFQKYGINRVTDQILNHELTLKVNVGMGATDPAAKLSKFLAGMQAYAGLLKIAPPGLNLQEVGKEIFGHLGYQDGKRFFTVDDPEKAQLQAKMQQMMKALQDKNAPIQAKVQMGREKNQTAVVVQAMKHSHENRQLLAENFMEHMVAPALAEENQQTEKPNGTRPN